MSFLILSGWRFELCCDLVNSTRKFLCWDSFPLGESRPGDMFSLPEVRETGREGGLTWCDWRYDGIMESGDIPRGSGIPVYQWKIIRPDLTDLSFFITLKQNQTLHRSGTFSSDIIRLGELWKKIGLDFDLIMILKWWHSEGTFSVGKYVIPSLF